MIVGSRDCQCVLILNGNLRSALHDMDFEFFGNNTFKDDDLICYCFEYTKKNIEEDFTTAGYSTILEKIKREKSINGCNCEIKNPKGK